MLCRSSLPARCQYLKSSYPTLAKPVGRNRSMGVPLRPARGSKQRKGCGAGRAGPSAITAIHKTGLVKMGVGKYRIFDGIYSYGY